MPTWSQIRTPLSQPVSVDEVRANLSHKGNDCSPLAAVVEYMSMPKLECPKFHGDPEDYCAFFRYFNENIHDKNIYLAINKNLLTCFKILMERLMMQSRIVRRCNLLQKAMKKPDIFFLKALVTRE